MEPGTTACFTGYRPQKLPWGFDEETPECRRLKARLYSAIGRAYAEGKRTFISGMAPGVDIYAAEAVVEFKRECPDAELVLALPYATYHALFKGEDRARFNRLVLASARTAVCSHVYHKGCMMNRNRFMVDNSSLVIAVYDNKPGGTRNTLEYAKSVQRDVWIILPCAI